MELLKQWVDNLYFSSPVYFLLFGFVWIMTGALICIILFKFLRRPRRSKHSRYRLLGSDLVWIWLTALCAFGVIALAGPQIKNSHVLSNAGSVDVIVVMDYSFSMASKDIQPSRQEAAKQAAMRLVDDSILAKGDRITFFVFGGNSIWRMPLSSDFNDFKAKVAEIEQPAIYEEESQLNTNFAIVIKHISECIDKQDNFDKNNEQKLNIKPRHNKRVALFFSDGNDEGSNKIIDGLSELQKRQIKAFTIGIGTKNGATITVKAFNPDDVPQTQSYEDEATAYAPKGPPVEITAKTSLNTKNLELIANRTGGSIFVLDSASLMPQLMVFLRNAVDLNRSFMPQLVYSKDVRDIWWEVLVSSSFVFFLLIIINWAFSP